LQKELQKALTVYLWHMENADGGPTSTWTLGKKFLKFWTSISRGEMITFWSFLSWIDIEDGIVFQKKSEKPVTFFPWQTEMRIRIQLAHGRSEILSSIFEPPYLEEKWSPFEVFFSWMDMEDDVVLQKKSKKPLIVFSWRTKMQIRVQLPRGH
jgi:hypothetical protein